VFLVVCAMACGGCRGTPTTSVDPQHDRRITNLRAFALVYGAVRWFHPSDEAAWTNWKAFARAGVERVQHATNRDELATALASLVGPIAPTVQFVRSNAAPVESSTRPDSAREWTWWQHSGAGLGEHQPPYTSKRRGYPLIATSSPTDPIAEPFEERPAPGQIAQVELGDGLLALVPLTLERQDGRTVPAGNPSALAEVLMGEPNEAAARLADVVVAWNVFAHFYPYLDVIGEDWNKVLDDALHDGLTEQGPDDHKSTLQRLVARARDGHGYLQIPGDEQARPAIRVDWVEGKLAVIASTDDQVRRGDIILALDGRHAVERANAAAALTSGSPQWKRARAARELISGKPGTEVVLQLERAGQKLTVKVKRDATKLPVAFDHPEIGELEPGIWYIDLDRATIAAIEATVTQLASARGVIVDLRGYPNGNHDLLRHLVRAPDRARWMHVPHLVRPFQRDVVGWDHLGWDIQPAEPYLERVVFVTGPGAISYAESVLGYAEAERIPIVGAASAGTNGNVQSIQLPTGARIRFTGMKVTKHDGSQHHLIGVTPTIPAAPTIAGLAAGRDEVVERAVAALVAGVQRR
jgi:C-terminal processing protease CtpA/Prc